MVIKLYDRHFTFGPISEIIGGNRPTRNKQEGDR